MSSLKKCVKSNSENVPEPNRHQNELMKVFYFNRVKYTDDGFKGIFKSIDLI